MIKAPLVSIVIPVYNTADYIMESVNSAIDQDYPNKEIIVIDDGSNEKTKKVLSALSSKIDFLISQDNSGQSTARNKGIEKAQGEYILIQDSDDYFKPSFIRRAVDILKTKPNIKFVSCYLNRFSEKGTGPLVKMEGGSLENFLFRNASIGNGLFRKDELIGINGYDETMRNGYEDWELIIRMLKKGGEAYIIPEPLFMYRSSLKLTTKKAQSMRVELLAYIFNKHQDIYVQHLPELLSFFSREMNILNKQSNKIKQSKEYKLGLTLLKPLRFLKNKKH